MRLEKKHFFSLLDPCRVVQGASVCAIYDLQNGIIKLYPKWVGDFINIYSSKKTIEEIILEGFYSEQEVEALLSELIARKFVILTRWPELFTVSEAKKYNSPVHLSLDAAIVDFDQNTKVEQHMSFFDELVNVGCSSLDVRFYEYKNKEDVVNVVYGAQQAGIEDVELYLNVDPGMESDITYIQANCTPSKMYCFVKGGADKKAPGNEVQYYFGHFTVDSCGKVNPDNFFTSIESFEKNTQFNECLSGKIGLDVKGNIKNCPSQVRSFGKVGDPLNHILALDGFNELRRVRKDDIEVCKDCVYRYCCTDCRVYVTAPGSATSKPKKCGYDPYTNTWNKVKEEFITLKGI